MAKIISRNFSSKENVIKMLQIKTFLHFGVFSPKLEGRKINKVCECESPKMRVTKKAQLEFLCVGREEKMFIKFVGVRLERGIGQLD